MSEETKTDTAVRSRVKAKRKAKPTYKTDHTRHADGHYILTTNDPKILSTLQEWDKGDGPRYILTRGEMCDLGRVPTNG